jgi:hypothetical protein
MACSQAMTARNRKVVGTEGTEADVGARVGSGPAQGVEGGDAFAFEWGGGQGLQVAVVGTDAHLEVAPQVARALSHLTPPPLAPACVVGDEAQDPELTSDC